MNERPSLAPPSDLHRMVCDYYKLDAPEVLEIPLLGKSFSELNGINFDVESYFAFKLLPELNLKSFKNLMQTLNKGMFSSLLSEIELLSHEYSKVLREDWSSMLIQNGSSPNCSNIGIGSLDSDIVTLV
ncbi:hypothetical protein MDAP_002686 [Mitosporidium daphniae]|uniref:Uncharacterized protein n=1 Tax=Mitosporidium daphniae TaxID=1485682 RepID=A0A098VPA3_9MICR|nr:uncharacterized protein DI09_55p70 [Mitosporidium daphniae]KGG50790.1 hypothetical protein DI09_55p70 [Mitosporidium daphniae]|eukprot:XP_013237237.1 uncharacterized protein DI09_55p70 [Mitosporidium daphniae]